jgi:hypothetical protein
LTPVGPAEVELAVGAPAREIAGAVQPGAGRDENRSGTNRSLVTPGARGSERDAAPLMYSSPGT